MFGFAIKKTSAPTAQESLTEVKPEDIRSYKDLNLSEGGRQIVITGTIRSIITATAKLLRMKGDKPEVVAEKLKTFIVACVSSGDLSKTSAENILADDWYFSSGFEYVPGYTTPADSLWSLFKEIHDGAQGSREWNSEYKYWNGRVNEQEKAILEAYEKARKAYLDACQIRDRYFAKKGALVVHDVLRKYASVLTNIDSEFYNFMIERIDETLSQMDDDNSCPSDPSIKNELATLRGKLAGCEQDEESEV